MSNPEKFWNRVANRYAKSPVRDIPAYNQTMDRTKTHLSTDDRVMEFGCGTGSTALLLAGGVKQITASDISGNMIEIAKAKAKEQKTGNVIFVRGSLEDDTQEDGSLDAVLAFNLLHLLEDLPAAVGGFGKLLKPGGVFISKTVCMAGHGLHWRILLPIMRAVGFAPAVRFMTIAELDGIIAGQGFEIIETGVFPASPPSRFIVARKT